MLIFVPKFVVKLCGSSPVSITGEMCLTLCTRSADLYAYVINLAYVKCV